MEEIIKYLGNFHPVVLHLPIGAFLFTFLLFISQKYLKSNFDPAVRLGLLFSFITSIITSVFGYILHLNGDYDSILVDRHMFLAIATTVLIGLVLYMHKNQKAYNHILSSFILSTILLIITGHNGGSLTHGKDYLKLPEFEKQIQIVSYDSIHVYNSVISPILDSKCVKCHNTGKSKGNLVLTSIDKILIGGEKGKIIKSKSPYDSRLFTYLNLPLDDKMHMPPEGNSQLSENEIQIIKFWIEEGVDFYNYRNINEDDFSKKILNFLPKKTLTVDPPKINNLINLIENKFRIERVSNESNFIDIKYTGEKLKQKDLNLLSKVDKNIKRLDFSGTDLSSIALKTLKSFENLSYLNLNNTSTNFDKIIDFLPNNLQTLIISNNKVNSYVFEKLMINPNLKRVYAYNTLTDKKNIDQITNYSNNKIYFGISLDEFASNIPLKTPRLNNETKTLFSDSLKIEVMNDISNPTYRYTLNGDDPDSISVIYEHPIIIKKSSTIKFKSFKSGFESSTIKEINYLKVADKINDLKLYSSPVEPYTGENLLSDNRLGTNNFGEGNWYGFLKSTPNNSSQNNAGDLIAEFSISEKVNEIGISCLSVYGSYILFPTKIELYDISGVIEKLIYSKSIDVVDNEKYSPKKIYKIPVNSSISKVKLKVVSNKNLPKGHPAQGDPAWLFVDEILLL